MHSTTIESKAAGARQGSPRLDLLGLYFAVTAGMLALGGWLTSLGMGPWYDNLRKPPFQPPAWVFTPVWTTLLSLLAVATWLVARSGRPGVRTALALYWAQVALNVGWSLLFFTLHAPGPALAEIAVLGAVLVAMVFAYGRVARLAGWLLVPYAIWLGLATAINVWIVWNN